MICKKCGSKFTKNDKQCMHCCASCLEQVKLDNYSMNKDFVSFINAIGIACRKSDLTRPTIAVPSNFKGEGIDWAAPQDRNPIIEKMQNADYNVGKMFTTGELKNSSQTYDSESYYVEKNDDMNIYGSYIQPQYNNEISKAAAAASLHKEIDNTQYNNESFAKGSSTYNKTTIYLIFIILFIIIITIFAVLIIVSNNRKDVEPTNTVVTTNITDTSFNTDYITTEISEEITISITTTSTASISKILPNFTIILNEKNELTTSTTIIISETSEEEMYNVTEYENSYNTSNDDKIRDDEKEIYDSSSENINFN